MVKRQIQWENGNERRRTRKTDWCRLWKAFKSLCVKRIERSVYARLLQNTWKYLFLDLCTFLGRGFHVSLTTCDSPPDLPGCLLSHLQWCLFAVPGSVWGADQIGSVLQRALTETVQTQCSQLQLRQMIFCSVNWFLDYSFNYVIKRLLYKV